MSDPQTTDAVTSTVTSSGEAYRRARDEGRGALVGYLPVGYPSVDGSLDAFRVLAEGCDLVRIDLSHEGDERGLPGVGGVCGLEGVDHQAGDEVFARPGCGVPMRPVVADLGDEFLLGEPLKNRHDGGVGE